MDFWTGCKKSNHHLSSAKKWPPSHVWNLLFSNEKKKSKFALFCLKLEGRTLIFVLNAFLLAGYIWCVVTSLYKTDFTNGSFINMELTKCLMKHGLIKLVRIHIEYDKFLQSHPRLTETFRYSLFVQHVSTLKWFFFR